jgi:murein DD-endopeptidase MepM/ murein hydrolase activator NlpD
LEGRLRSVEQNMVSISGVPESDPAMINLRDQQRTLRADLANLEKRLNQHEKDKELRQKNSPDKVTGIIAKTQDRVKEKLLEKGKLQKATGAAGRIYSIIKKIDQDPIGFLLDQTVGRSLRFIWGKIWRSGLGLGAKAADWLLKRSWGKAVLFGTNLLKDSYQKGLNGLIKLGSRLLGRALGYFVGAGIRFSAALAVGAVGVILTPIVLIVLGTIGLVVVIALIFIMVLAPLYVGLNPPVAAASPSDLALVVTADKRQGVIANETVAYTINVTSHADRITGIDVTATPDSNFSSVAPQDGGTASGLTINWPVFDLSLGETRVLRFTAVTSSSVTAQTPLQIQVAAVSPDGFSSSTIMFLNRVGGSIGADGRHAYPVLGSNSWSCSHSSPNFNAIDIFAAPGTPVVATIGGRAQISENSLGGPVVFLYGDDGFNYYYAHLEASGRVSGQVSLGEVLGTISGDTIRSRNNGIPHVHFSIDTRGIHDGPNTPAGPFLDAVGGTSRCP